MTEGSSASSKRRKLIKTSEAPETSAISPSAMSSYNYRATPYHISGDMTPSGHMSNDHSFLATLSFAAEQAALQDSLAAAPIANMRTVATSTPMYNQNSHPMANESPSYRYNNITSEPQYPPVPDRRLTVKPRVESPHLPEESTGLDFEGSLDDLAAFLDNGAMSSYHFSSLISAEQPVPFFSPESLSRTGEGPTDSNNGHGTNDRNSSPTRFEEQSSFSRFGSRLPSLQPEEKPRLSRGRPVGPRPFSDLSAIDRQILAEKFSYFVGVVSPDFKLPSRLAFSRYIAAYINGFHEHLPFLHIPTMRIETCSIELALAMAAVGAQYCFEGDRGVELFHASQAIASRRIRRKDARLASQHHRGQYDYSSRRSSVSFSLSGPGGLSSDAGTPIDVPMEDEDLMQTAQALLILMAMATWAKHKEILREALAIQSVLATLVRDDGLRSQSTDTEMYWEVWVRAETTKRTKFIVFCFFNLHCIVYNIPPLILNSELKMTLPSSSAEFKATNVYEWREARKKATKSTTFQDALGRLFSRGGRDITEWNSSLGNYILIHAIIQHIFFIRQTAKCRFNSDGDLLSEEVSSLEQALRNWQAGWRRNPESSLDPMDPNGPVAFNSTALLRLAYIRLNVDTGPGRALDTRDPLQIAHAFRESPPIKRTPKLVRAVLHSAHALSIPVKIGVRLVAQTQTFIWSIQHSLCSCECAFLLSRWLEALSVPNPDPPVSDDERRIAMLVKTMLDETEFAVPDGLTLDSPATVRHLSAGVLRVWATIFRGAQTWAIVDVIGTSLHIYADMLEADLLAV